MNNRQEQKSVIHDSNGDMHLKELEKTINDLNQIIQNISETMLATQPALNKTLRTTMQSISSKYRMQIMPPPPPPPLTKKTAPIQTINRNPVTKNNGNKEKNSKNNDMIQELKKKMKERQFGLRSTGKLDDLIEVEVPKNHSKKSELPSLTVPSKPNTKPAVPHKPTVPPKPAALQPNSLKGVKSEKMVTSDMKR